MKLTIDEQIKLMEHFENILCVCREVENPWYVQHADKNHEFAALKPYDPTGVEQAAKNELGIDLNYEEFWNNTAVTFEIFLKYIETFQTYYLNHHNRNTQIESHQLLALASPIRGFAPEVQDHNLLICKFKDTNKVTSFFCSASINSLYALNKFMEDKQDLNPYSINDQVDNKLLNHVTITSDIIAKSCIHYFNHFEDTTYDPEKIANISNLYQVTDTRIEPFMGNFKDLHSRTAETKKSYRYFVSCSLGY